jgi:hypothetical protein
MKKYSPGTLKNSRKPRRPSQTEIDTLEVGRQRTGVIVALDKLFAAEVLAADRHPKLRLVWPAIEAIDRDSAGEGLRTFITRRGRDLYAIGGQLELFATVRAVMVVRPERQAWNRTQLASLWGSIGENGSEVA